MRNMHRRAFLNTVARIAVAYGGRRRPDLPLSWLGLSTVSDRYNVKEFGALGNGAADDTIPFERAIAAAARKGGTVVVPSGRFSVKRSLHLRDGVTLEGLGWQSTIESVEGEPIVIVCVDAREVGVHNLAITGKFSFGVLVERSLSAAVIGCIVNGGTERWLTSAY